MDEKTVASLLARLSIHLVKNPLTPQETAMVNAALLAARALVDVMDEGILQSVYADLDRCVAAAQASGRTVEAKAQLYIALWINMSGPPTKLLTWLAGADPGLPGPLPHVGARVDGLAMEAYLRATNYYMENAGNLPHMLQSVAAGMAVLGTGLVAAAVPLGLIDTGAGAAITRVALDTGDGSMAKFARAALALTSPPGAAAGRIDDDDADDVSEFEHQDIHGVFTENSEWLRAPLTPQLISLYFEGAQLGDFDVEGFADHIRSLGLKHFGPIEFLYLGGNNGAGKCKGTNHPPPQALWKNIDKTARMLDRIRELLGAEIRILSCYRARPYNDCVGGKNASQHLDFNAIDWTCASGSVEAWRETARQVRAESPDYMGGIGFYPQKRFIHIDTRGHEANW